MNLRKKIYYWSPSLVDIATNRSVINSAQSMVKYDPSYQAYIINFFGEFERYKNQIIEKNINLINFFNKSIFKFLPKYGKIKSRASFIFIFLMAFIPLKNIIKNDKPDYLIIHLITSLPLSLLILFNFQTKFILRISGYPKMNFFRKFLWSSALKNIYCVTCPTISTMNYIKSLNIVDPIKVKLLYDPIINVKEINKKKNEDITHNDFFFAAGRLTYQKNFQFLCKAFKKLIIKDKNLKLLIAGEGEDRKKIENFINNNALDKNIVLLGYVENIYPFFKNAKGFILTSLWEDPGFVLIEASFCKVPVLSSNVGPGPSELVQDSYNGILYKNNDLDHFEIKFNRFKKFDNLKTLRLNSLKVSKKFTIFNHYKNLNKILSKQV